MLIPILFLGSVAAGSYAFLPSTWHKLRHKLRREKGVADPTLSPLTMGLAQSTPQGFWISWPVIG